ncbi:2,3-bisphosphoglycerate-independent phosphoglycerate mutase [Gemmatimonas sp.]|jgi:2,3-bisphosphoglycerate-independent phosphoglycerate mutase|uniref:2,3-bisphosphoglycerate-independent phosphoglycerate mutase n=1 Tax=Gemmatimonas sp. TaxID=1962908 RepID=UPI0037BF1D63
MTARPARAVALIILDGWGYREERDSNAILMADTPNWHRSWAHESRTLLTASGRAVGLPDGQMGNSEVGHLNLGAGRIVMQDLVRIGSAIEDGSFFQNGALVQACDAVHATGGTLHLLGLLGDGGVHAHDAHLMALVALAQQRGVRRVVLHAMLDGRDTPPQSAMGFLRAALASIGDRAQLASVSGRYYGMDRDNRWERTGLWYRAAVRGDAPVEVDALAALQRAYDAGTTDEFVHPYVMAGPDGAAIAPMRDGDAVICFNYRSDRMRQTLRALAMPDFSGFDTGARPTLSITTMTSYDDAFPFPVAFAPQSMRNLVGEVIANAGLTQLRIAETEKYPHVTFFFNGGRDEPFPGEERQMMPSPKVATYDLQPEMSAAGVCDILCHALAHRTHDFMLCNFANTDMVGHTGSIPAAIRAVEAVDACLGRILDAAEAGGARLIITADHGNADVMVDPVTHQPHTAHTTNPVPLVVLDPDETVPLRRGGALCDVGPTALALLGLTLPPEITGRDLRDLSDRSPSPTV